MHTENRSKTEKFWNDYHLTREDGRKNNWWDCPTILNALQEKVTGSPNVDVYQFLKENLHGWPFEKAISICSGSGDFEAGLFENGICKAIDAYEIAEERINAGKQMAQKNRYNICFHRQDINEAFFGENGPYDAFFSWSALHHIENLEAVLQKAHTCLKEAGILIAQEYIGPSRFQWTDAQLRIVNQVLSILPQTLKKNNQIPGDHRILTRIGRPSISQMQQSDPSEAIRSQEIVPILERFFDIHIIRHFGGALFHPLFGEIIGNFDPANEYHNAIIRLILFLEGLLTDTGILDQQFALIIATKSNS